jgi:RNA polymerase sigma-70 factor (ECF subfamily)
MNAANQDVSLHIPVRQLAAMRDAQLVSAARAGSVDSFAELQRLYSRHLYSTIVAITKNREDAEDALQDTFLRAHLALRSFEGRSSFYSWLTRIAINSALQILRRRRAHLEVSFDFHFETGNDISQFEIKDPAPNPEQICDQRQRWVSMVHAIQRLEPSLQHAIQIRIAHGTSLKEIERKLDISVAAVKSRLHRARKGLTKVSPLRSQTRSGTVPSIPRQEGRISGLQNREQSCMSCR